MALIKVRYLDAFRASQNGQAGIERGCRPLCRAEPFSYRAARRGANRTPAKTVKVVFREAETPAHAIAYCIR